MGRNQVRPSRGSWSDWIGIEDRIRWNLKTAARNLSNSVAVHSIPLLCLSLCVSLCVSVWKCDDRIDDTQQQQQQQQEEDEETVSVFKVGCRIRWDSCGILTGSLRDSYGTLKVNRPLKLIHLQSAFKFIIHQLLHYLSGGAVALRLL